MTMTDGRPRLKTPEGGAMSQPDNPAQWHSRPYVWAFHAIGGSLSTDYIESVCKRAEAEDAPPDAVYKTRDDDPSMPGEWVTVGMMANADQQSRVREYAHALVEWADALKAYRRGPEVRQLQVKQPDTDVQAAQGQHEYVITFEAKFTGVVTANSLLEACQKMTPGERFAPSGYGVLDLAGENGVQWHAAFDSCKSKIVSTTDPRVNQPYRSPEKRAQPQPAEVPVAEESAEVPAAAEDTAAPAVPTEGRGLSLVKRRAQQR